MKGSAITMAKLMNPLFIGGMFNREGKKIRAEYLKNIGNYPIWIIEGEYKQYPYAENDKYYLYIQHGDWIAPIGCTEYQLIENVEGGTEVNQATLIKNFIHQCIEQYNEAKNNTDKFPNFIGALFSNELYQCNKLSSIYKIKQEEKEIEMRKLQAEQEAIEAEEAKRKEKLKLKEVEDIFITGGKIKGGDIIVKLADKYNINIPIRTRGWILNTFAESTIEHDKISCRYYKVKNGKGSTKIYDILHAIRTAILQSA